jgi:uncharacterized protein (TIGR03382 family)
VVAPIYGVTVNGNTVVVCVSDALCNASAPLLREDATTGALVRLAPFCVAADAGAGIIVPDACYQDDCVPKGTYNYGLVTPLPCGGCGNTAAYYDVATVSQDLPAGCMLSSGNSGDVAYDGGTPWPAGAQFESDCSGCSQTGSPLFGVSGALALVSLALVWRARRRRA